MLEEQEKKQFKREGYVTLEDVVDESTINEAREIIWDALPISPDSPLEEIQERDYEYVSLNTELEDTEPFRVIRDDLFEVAGEFVGRDKLTKPTGEVDMPTELQIVINYPKDLRFSNVHLRDMGYGPRGTESTAGGHLDGYGIKFRHPDAETTFNYSTIGAGVYLDTVDIGGGGLTVYPGSHWIAKKYFEDHSLEAPGWTGQLPAIDDEGEWNYDGSLYRQLRAKELTGSAGTVIFWHQRLLHCAAPNQRQDLRMATFSRFTRREGEEIQEDAATNLWKYWDGMQDIDVNIDEQPIEY